MNHIMKQLILVFSSFCLLLTGFSFDLYASENTQLSQSAGVAVSVFEAQKKDIKNRAKVLGDIESNTAPKIAAEVTGKIISMLVREGESVQTGQVLAKQDPEPLLIARERALADIQRIKALIRNQMKIVARNKKLIKEKVVSQNRLDDAQTALNLSEADLIAVKAQLKDVEYKLKHVEIISPINGFVQKKYLSLGDYVKIGKPVYQLVSLDDIQARIYLPISIVDTVKTGAEVTLIHENQLITGKIKNLRPMLDISNRSLDALVEFENTRGWKPGINIVAEVELGEHKGAVVIPQKALVRRPEGLVVYKLHGHKVSEQLVKTGLETSELVEVLQGVAEGDKIILDGAAFLSDGTEVKVMENSL